MGRVVEEEQNTDYDLDSLSNLGHNSIGLHLIHVSVSLFLGKSCRLCYEIQVYLYCREEGTQGRSFRPKSSS